MSTFAEFAAAVEARKATSEAESARERAAAAQAHAQKVAHFKRVWLPIIIAAAVVIVVAALISYQVAQRAKARRAVEREASFARWQEGYRQRRALKEAAPIRAVAPARPSDPNDARSYAGTWQISYSCDGEQRTATTAPLQWDGKVGAVAIGWQLFVEPRFGTVEFTGVERTKDDQGALTLKTSIGDSPPRRLSGRVEDMRYPNGADGRRCGTWVATLAE